MVKQWITRQRQRKGFVFLFALTGLIFMMTLGISFVGIGLQQLDGARRELCTVQTLAAAEGGVNYAQWIQIYPPSGDSNNLQSTSIPTQASLGTNLHLLNPSTTTPSWHLTTANAGGSGDSYSTYIWFSQYTAGTISGYQVIAQSQFRNYTKSVREIFYNPTTTSSTSPTQEDLMFAQTLYTNSALSFNGACNIGGNTVVNGDLTMTASGSFLQMGSPAAGGNVLVNGNLTMSGNAVIQGNAIVAKSINPANGNTGSASIQGSAQVLGNVNLASDGTLNNITLNGNANISGGNLTGTMNCVGNFTNTGWGGVPSSLNYSGSYTNTGNTGYNSIKHNTVLTPLPASTANLPTFPTINMTQYSLGPASAYGTTLTGTGGTYTVTGGTPQLTATTAYVNGNLTVNSGVMNLPSEMNYYINGNLNTEGNTTFNGKDITLYVNGNVNMNSGTFNLNATGKVIIVATGTINISGGYNLGTSKIVLLSSTGITFGGNSNPSYVTMYCHNANNTGVVTINSANIQGAVITDQTSFTGSGSTFYYAAPSYTFLPSGSSGSSTNTNSWNKYSWEELY